MTTKGRKTIEVVAILDTVNFFLKMSECSADRRQGHIDIINQVLTASENYGGFRYLTIGEVPAGHLPGITPDFKNTDQTRVCFFLKYNQ